MEIFTALGFWLCFIFLGSFDVIGLVEGGKSVAASIKAGTKIWIATVANFVLSYAVAFFIGQLPGAPIFGSLLGAVLFGGTTMFAFGEIIGYNVIVKTIFALFDAVIAWAEKKLGKEGAPVSFVASDDTGKSAANAAQAVLDTAPIGTPGNSL